MSAAAIRPYQPSDLDACRGLWVELTAWHREIYDSPGIGGDEPGLLFDAHLAKVGPERLWVAEEAGRVVGLTGFIPRDEGPEIEPVIVARSHRGRGIGRMLIQQVVEAVQALGEGTLSVSAVGRNAQAIGFYHAMGFDIVGYVELMQDFREDDRPWRPGNPLAGRDFLV